MQSFFRLRVTETDSNECVILSSDAVREQLFGDASYQEHSDDVFEIVKRDTERALSCGCSVYLDATNIRKDWREWAITLGKKYRSKVCGIVFHVPYNTARKRDKMRSRTVGWTTLLKYIFKYQAPTFDEGFDVLIYVDEDGTIITKQTER